jgi:DNA polymerase-3 subunit beta
MGIAMDLNMPCGNLVSAIDRVARLADSRGGNPVLSCVLLEASSLGLSVTATDLVVRSEVLVPAAVAASGSVCVSARMLAAVAAQLAGGDVSLSVSDGVFVVRSARRVFRMPALDASEYPARVEVAAAAPLPPLPSSSLRTLIARVAYAVPRTDERPHLGGVRLEFDGATLRATATDGHRIATAPVPCDQKRPGVLIPRRVLRELGELMAESDAIGLAVGPAHMELSTPRSNVQCSLVEGAYPDAKSVIPVGSPRWVSCGRVALRDAVRAVSALHSSKGDGVVLDIRNWQIIVCARDVDGDAEASDTIDADHQPDATPIRIGVNAAYLLGALGAIDADRVRIAYDGSLDPLLMSHDGAEHVVMPMRI